jgi:membrane protease YdiL (CAAX protease family)
MLRRMASPRKDRTFNPWTLLLLLPFAGLCFPQMYNRETPVLFGLPFFYWYQFAWVFLGTLVLGLVYFKTRDRSPDR